LGDLHVARGRLVEGRGDDLAAHGALHLGHFLRALVDQQHDQVHVRVVGRDRGGDLLHHHRLARLRLGDDQRALALALRGHQVEDAAGDVLGRAVAALQPESPAREQRGQVLEQGLVLARLQRLAVDGVHHRQGEVALAVLGPADAAGQVVAGTQVEAADLAGRDVGVVRAGQVAGLGAAQEAVAVRQDLQHAVGLHALAVAGEHLQQGEDHVLLARAGHALVDVQLLGDLQQLVCGHALEVAEGVGREALGHARLRPLRVLLAAVAALVLHAAFLAEALALAFAAVAEALAAVAAAALALLALAAVVAALAAVAVLAVLALRRALLAATLRGGRLLGRRGLGRLRRVLGAALRDRGRGRGRGGRRRSGSGRRRGHRQRSLDRRVGGGGFGGAGSGVGGLGHALAGALLGGCVVAPGRFRLGVLGQDWNSSLADASARKRADDSWVGCAGLARLAAATFRRDGGRAARPDLPTLAPGSWRRQAPREAGGA